MLELFPSVRELGIWDAFIESIETGTPARVDLPYFNEHGVEGSFDLAVTPGDEGIIIDAREVSEARRVEEALRASEERFRASVEVLQDGFAVFCGDPRQLRVPSRTSAMSTSTTRGAAWTSGPGRTRLGTPSRSCSPGRCPPALLAEYIKVARDREPLAREDADYEDV